MDDDVARRTPASPATFVVLFGPPAVGKMTVGRALSVLTGFPLFHNHMTIEPLLPFFEFGSPPFARLVRLYRNSLFEEVAASQHRGLIFTWVWAFDMDEDREFVDASSSIFEAQGWRTVFVELQADLDTRLLRNATPERIAAKPSKQDVEASNRRLLALDERFRLSSGGAFPYPERYLFIDNTDLAAVDAARRIAAHFQLA